MISYPIKPIRGISLFLEPKDKHTFDSSRSIVDEYYLSPVRFASAG